MVSMEIERGSWRDSVMFRCWKFSEKFREQTLVLQVVGRRPTQWAPCGLPSVCCSHSIRRKLLAWGRAGENNLHAKGHLCFLTLYCNLSSVGFDSFWCQNYCSLRCVFRNLGCRDLNFCYFWHPPCKCRQMHLEVAAGLQAFQSQQGLDVSHWALSIKLKWLREGITFPNCISLRKCMFQWKLHP